jgi:hypothetical protein
VKANWRLGAATRRRAVLAAALLLAGCNSVTSTTPWFSAADAEGGKPCDVKEGQSLTTWPSCAMGLVVRPGDVLGLDTKEGKLVWSSLGYVFAAGDPRILQITDDPEAKSYDYIGANAAKLDDAGRVVSFRGWIVGCRPPATSPTGDIPPDYPGLNQVSGASGCTAQSIDALRAAAKASEPPAGDGVQARWVREGDR